MFKEAFLIALYFFLNQFISAQQLVYSAGRAKDAEYHKSQQIIPVFRLTVDTVEENNAFGVESKFKNKKKQIIVPEVINYRTRNGYGYFYFGGATNSFAPGYILFLITDNNRGISPSLIFIDKNNDYDLTNDGPPDTLRYTDKQKYIILNNNQYSQAKHIIKISRFNYNRQARYIQLTDSHYVRHSGSKEYMGTFYSFREQRLNLLAANFKSTQKEDSFTLGFKDENCNGSFIDPGIDQIFIAPYKTAKFSDLSFELNTDGTAFIEYGGNIFKLTNIKPNGNTFNIELDSNASFLYRLNIGLKVPHFKYQKADSGKTKYKKLCKLRKKPAYIFFSYSFADNFDEDTTLLRQIDQKYGDKINILFLNSGDVSYQAKKIAVLNNLPYYCGISDEDIEEEWFVRTKPSYFLLDKKLILNKIGITPKELLLYLQLIYD